MWFDDDKMLGRRLGGKRAGQVLQVNATLRAQRKAGVQWTAIFVLVPVALVILGIVGWFGLRAVGGALFFRNDRFTLTNLEIKAGEIVTADLVKEYTGIHEGMNLFSMNIGRIRNDLLKRVPNIKAMHITRVLPNTLKIEMVERIPVARLGVAGKLVVDDEGFVFWQKSATGNLPAVTGYKDKDEALHAGMRLKDMGLAALEVLEACDDPSFGVTVKSIDAGNEEYLLVDMIHFNVETQVKLSWVGMSHRTPDSKRRLLEKLTLCSQTFLSEQGRRFRILDATYDGGRIYGE
jgi:hypothetical protein